MPAHGSYKSALQKKFGRPRGQNSSRQKHGRILYQRKSDYRNGYRISYPCKKNRDVQYTMRSLRRFLLPEADPSTICTKTIMEFTKACEGLHWNHGRSSRRRSQTDCIAQRAVRRVKEGTSSLFVQSSLNESWWEKSRGMLFVVDEHSRFTG